MSVKPRRSLGGEDGPVREASLPTGPGNVAWAGVAAINVAAVRTSATVTLRM